MYKGLYDYFVLPAITGGFRILCPFVPKIKEGFAGRIGLCDRVRNWRVGNAGDLILFHCASAGEYDALRPLAPLFDRERVKLAVSYFSPSARKSASSGEFDFADFSPHDADSAVREYLRALQPNLIAITKHDVWPNFVWCASSLGIPVFLINGNFHPGSLKNIPPLRALHREIYSALSGILVVSEDDALRARALAGDSVPVIVAGDSRFDRVYQRSQLPSALPESILSIVQGKAVFVAGSTHDEDEALLFHALSKISASHHNLLTVIVPHDPSPKARKRILARAAQSGLSCAEHDGEPPAAETNIMLINRTGLLADLYQTGDFAFVGGAFGKGVHSILEPMAHGLPVICGPNIGVSFEARKSREEQLLTVVESFEHIAQTLQTWLSDEGQLNQLKIRARDFVAQRIGSAEKIARFLDESLHVHTCA